MNPEPPRILRARWLLPVIAPPIENGWIEIAGGRIVRLGRGRLPAPAQDLGDVVVLPGLVNAHTHLELSWMAGLIPPAARMVDWIRMLMAARRAGPPGGEAQCARAIGDAVQALESSGTVLLGDVTNTCESVPFLRDSHLAGVLFVELLGFRELDPAARVDQAWRTSGTVPRFETSVVAHAPYSVSPELFEEIARSRQSTAPLSVHLAESDDEIEFLRTGSGAFRELLEELDVWRDDFTAPQCNPVEYLQRLGYLQRGMLAVHAVHLTDDALDALRDAGGAVVTCPRSNAWVGGGLPRIAHAYAEGVAVAIGTDSLASSPTLSVFDELAELRRIAPDVAAAKLLESATRTGAQVLGYGADFGTLEPGKRAALVAVDVPSDVSDVEEYLVSGVATTAIRPRVSHPRSTNMLSRLRTYASFVRFSHSVFALPFALVGALLAARVVPFDWTRVIWIVACMVLARSAAMGFNRLVDATYDARNPRTAMRELPAGRMSRAEAIAFVAISSLLFIVCTWPLGFVCFALSPVALGIVFWYSLAKRVTSYTQLFLGLAMAVAPVGGWLAAGGRGGWEPWLLGLAIGTWVGGFDVLYACQDVDVDRREGLRSIPVRFGVARSLAISRAMHVVTLIALATLGWVVALGPIYFAGVLIVGALLVWEQSLVRADDLSQVKRAFDLNGWVGILYLVTTAAAIYW